MQTYYQKHRTIQAFQFDGSFKQLKAELPIDIITNIINYYTEDDHEDILYIKQNQKHQIAELIVDITKWPKRNIKVKHPNHYWKIYLSMNRRVDYMHIVSAFKYDFKNEILHLGDYVTIQCGQNDERNGYPNNFQIKIYQKNDFEAHWSPHPIRKDRHHANH